MPRPRTPSNVLELSGAFKKNPQRKRADAQGAGPFNPEPPDHLPGAVKAAWRRIVERLPQIAISSSDEMAVERAATLLAALDGLHPQSQDYKRLDDALRMWFIQLGLTPQARTKIPPAGSSEKQNRFAQFTTEPPKKSS